MKNLVQAMLKKFSLSFWLIVVVPTVCSIVYFGLIASDRYVSESKFVVRSPQKSTSVSGLAAILQNVGFSRSTDDSYVVNDYVLSRDAMGSLDQELNLRQKFTSGVDVFSRFDPLGFDNSSEMLYDYYKNKVKTDLDTASSISTLTVRAYTAEDAQKINARLLELAEGLVNKLNERGRQDMLMTAEDSLHKAENRVKEVATQLAQYRGVNQVFDVEKQSVVQMQLMSKLQDQLIIIKTQLAQVRAVTPDNPQINVLELREKSIREEMAKEMQKSLGAGRNSLSQKAIEYEKLMLERDFATKQLAAAMATLEQTKSEASKKQLYLERIAQPQTPDSAVEPSRFRNIMSVFLMSLVLLGVYRLMVSGVKEHQE